MAESRSSTTKPFCMTGPKGRSMRGSLQSVIQPGRPANAPSQDLVVHGRLPAAALDVRVLLYIGLHVVAATAMPQGEIQNFAGAMRMQIQHRTRLIREPFSIGETPLRFPVVMGMQEDAVRAVKLGEIQ